MASEVLIRRCMEMLRFSSLDVEIEADLIPYIDAAKEYLRNAGVKADNTELYYRVVSMIVARWYEDRLDGSGSIGSQTIGLNSLITQLALKQQEVGYEVGENET